MQMHNKRHSMRLTANEDLRLKRYLLLRTWKAFCYLHVFVVEWCNLTCSTHFKDPYISPCTFNFSRLPTYTSLRVERQRIYLLQEKLPAVKSFGGEGNLWHQNFVSWYRLVSKFPDFDLLHWVVYKASLYVLSYFHQW